MRDHVVDRQRIPSKEEQKEIDAGSHEMEDANRLAEVVVSLLMVGLVGTAKSR